jgi:hypothetical protein
MQRVLNKYEIEMLHKWSNKTMDVCCVDSKFDHLKNDQQMWENTYKKIPIKLKESLISQTLNISTMESYKDLVQNTIYSKPIFESIPETLKITEHEAWEIRAEIKVLRSTLKTQCPKPVGPPKPTIPTKPAFPRQALRANVLMTKYDLAKLGSEQ